LSISEIINELGEDREQYFNAVSPPIIQTSNFTFKKVADFRAAFQNEFESLVYSRGGNPTVNILRQKLAALDGAEDCLVFNSGAAAITASVMSQVQTGDHIVSVRAPYSWAQKLFENLLAKFGVTHTYIEGTQIANWQSAIQPNTKVFYLESPNSWTYELQDLKAVAALAKQKNIITIIDNSFCTPLYQKPIELGIDMSLQSATKYIGGHSDVVAGVLTGSKALMRKIFESELMTLGNAIQPFNAWLLIRGLRTLPIRLQRSTETTRQVLAWLKNHPKVEQVIFPFDEAFPQLELAHQQMTGACGLLTFVIKVETVTQIETFSESLQHIMMAVSWGGHESLIIPRCAGIPSEKFDANNVEHRMLRLYVGLEEPEYLIEDLGQAFEKMG
jgi:cystathionine beta-lyase